MIFDFDSGPKHYAVMGNPVAHSKSPRIHQQFAEQCKVRLEYTAIQVDPGGFAQAVGNFQAAGGKGLNVTVPFKIEAFRLADNVSERAELAGAVNTLKFDKQGLFGDNTDGIGLVRDLTRNLNADLVGARILVIGAGGAVRGVLGPLLDAAPASLTVANRTPEKAYELLDVFHDERLSACALTELTGRQFDVVINGTAASLKGEVPELPEHLFAANALAYDMMYGDKPTAFMIWATAHGAAHVSDGLGMLVEQAAESFYLWHGKRPQTQPVIAALRG